MNIVDSLTDHQILELHQLYQQEWWTNSRTIEQTNNGVKGSQIVIAVTDENQLVGFARVLTDYTFKALIFDLMVHKDYRGQKLGSVMIEKIKQHPKLSNVIHFELYCLPELFEYYHQHDFDDNLGGIKLMRFKNAQ
jgi:GNAT superfamily N-acetyltransferase